MAGDKNLYTAKLEAGEEKVFQNAISWISIGQENPNKNAGFELHGLGETSDEYIVCMNQAWASPENCNMVSEVGNEIKVVALSDNLCPINITYRY
ncbi:MAG: hypothetical protein RLZZ175_3034 [Bacteroidota bacterium]|jgi:hypothetical protein